MSAPSAEQLEEIYQALVDLRAELLILIADEMGATDTVELDQSTQGRLSRMDAIQQQKMAEAQQRRAAQRLKRVEVVMAGWSDPELDFGCCRLCGEFIAYARLKAKPDAIFCVPCAQAREG